MTTHAEDIQKMLAKDTFDVFGVLEGRSFPTDEVTVVTNPAALYEIVRLENLIADSMDGDEVNALDEQIAALKERARDSALTFHLRGFPYSVVEDIENAIQEENPDLDLSEGPGAVMANSRYVAASIVKVVKADGSEDTRNWTASDVDRLRGSLYPDQFEQILDTVQRLSFSSAYFESAVSADFLSKR